MSAVSAVSSTTAAQAVQRAKNAQPQSVQGHAALQMARKAMDLQASQTMQLLAAVPTPAASAAPRAIVPGGVGQNVDTHV